ncbi:MAG: hypothetical protein OXD49_00395 [Candidatus Poribacteria bacterium]|nr:hypothetical protein [Candidatus Poribacteria bacterium]
MIHKLTTASWLLLLLLVSKEEVSAQHKFTPISLHHLPEDMPPHIREIFYHADRQAAGCFDYCGIQISALDALLKAVEVRIAAETAQARAIANQKIHAALVKAATPIFAQGLLWRPTHVTKNLLSKFYKGSAPFGNHQITMRKTARILKGMARTRSRDDLLRNTATVEYYRKQMSEGIQY